MTNYIDPFEHVDRSMFKENRERFVSLVKNKIKEPIIVIMFQGGKSAYRYDTDVEYIFRQESNFYYLFGVEDPNCYGIIVIDNDNIKTILSQPIVDPMDAVWRVPMKPNEYYESLYIDKIIYNNDIADYLKSIDCKKIYTIGGRSCADRDIEPLDFKGKAQFDVIDNLYPIICESRIIKSEKELDLMRFVNKISSEAHMYVMQQASNFKYEQELEAEFLRYIIKHYRCRHLSYPCICCSATQCATLHYNDNDKLIKPNSMLLLDMGADYYNYASDITCSYPASGKFTKEMREIYEIVYEAQIGVEKKVKEGVGFRELQLTAYEIIAKGLDKLGFFNQELTNELIIKIGRVFMPHGFGHQLGLDVHDVTIEDHTLRPNMVITVEPGIYFITQLLNKEENTFLNMDIVNNYVYVGGVRLEDCVIVHDNHCENMTKVIRDPDAIEEMMQR